MRETDKVKSYDVDGVNPVNTYSVKLIPEKESINKLVLLFIIAYETVLLDDSGTTKEKFNIALVALGTCSILGIRVNGTLS